MASYEIVEALFGQRDFYQAAVYLHKSLEFLSQNAILYQLLDAVKTASVLVAAQGQSERAVELLAMVVAHPALISSVLVNGDKNRAELLLAGLRDKLTPDEFAAA